MFRTIKHFGGNIARRSTLSTSVKAISFSLAILGLTLVGTLNAKPLSVKAAPLPNMGASWAATVPGDVTPSAPKVVVAVPIAKATTVTQAAPQCATGQAEADPTAPTLSPDSPGLHVNVTPNMTYTIYGNNSNEINTQMARCTPITADSDEGRFAASTNYAINWIFQYQGNGAGQCSITMVSVGVTVTQEYPSWQATAGANPATATNWQAFINNLHTHENGHSELDKAAAATILRDLQSLPPSDCGTISAIANARANADMDALNQANNAYDASTNHGLTQGATLR